MLQLYSDIPPYSLQGLTEFSHVWLISCFHENTNTGVKGLKAKVAPPRLGGQKTGLFSTRTPHRVNPIALSLAKIIKVEGNKVYFSGTDLIDGTPIMDLKPYVPEYDCQTEAKIPQWLISPPANLDRDWSITFQPQVDEKLIEYLTKTLFFRNEVEEMKIFVTQVLQHDVRSRIRRLRMQAGQVSNEHSIRLNGLEFLIRITTDNVDVEDVKLIKETKMKFSNSKGSKASSKQKQR